MSIRPWQLAALGLSAFALLVWFGGPLLSIGGAAPLAGERARGALVAVFVLQYLALKGAAAWRARRRNDRVVDQLAPPAAGAEAPEVAQLRRRFAAALATLRRTRFGPSGGFWSSLSWKFGRQYLYQIPWYVIIGAPGAGKTTALLNSGLRFPLEGEFGRASIKGVGGTRHCDWWFTDRAVLLDTAGRYTTHEADRVADRQAWEGFLALLKRARPRQPLNGVLVAVSAADLLAFDPVQRGRHAAALRARLEEIRDVIGIRLPVYLLVTKCDLLPGFLDSFLAFDRRSRDQVWGTTFAWPASERGAAAEDFPAAFEGLVARLYEGLVERMQRERDPQRRARIFALPRHFADLGAPLGDLVGRAFGPAGETAQATACLRGVYFASGTQEGTPIDRALSALGRELGLQAQILPPNQSTGRSFFLADLLREVVLREAEIAGRSLRWQRWRARAVTALLALIQCAGALLAAWWVTGYSRGSAEVGQIASDTAAVGATLQAFDARPGADPRPLLPALDALQGLARSASLSSGADPAAATGFGAHQRRKLGAAARQAYDRMLVEPLLARITEGIGEQMRSGFDSALQYEALKAYAMLHEPSHFDAAALKTFVLYQWDSSLDPPLGADDRSRLAGHLDALVEAGAAGQALEVDARLVESVQRRLTAQPLSQRIATRLKAELGARSYPDFEVASLGEDAAALFAGRDGRSAPPTVSGRYTVAAYRDAVSGLLPPIASQLGEEAPWVLAAAGPAAAAARTPALEALSSYLDDYARSWTALAEDLRLRRTAYGADAARQARALAAYDGPLDRLLQAVARQTALPDAGPDALGGAAAPLARQAAGRFVALQAMTLRGPDRRRPLDTVLSDFGALGALRALAESKTADDDAIGNATRQLEAIRSDAKRLPEPLHSMLLALAGAPAARSDAGTAAALAPPVPARGADALASACDQSVRGRFPFERGSERDIAIADFNRLFGPSGLFDQAAAQSPGPREAAAARISEVFFASGRAEAAVRATFRPHDMDETIDRFVLHIDGQTVAYAHGPPTPTVVTWPGPAPGARVEISPEAPGQPALEFDGPWAFFRLLDRVAVEPIAPGRFRVVFNVGGRRASFDVETESGSNPFRMPELEQFSCPPRS